ncbi:Uncharacterised protein [Achromobacter xylosoxidans]|nr:Uncharacterised protein [Achromobacter xylosoxidans]
MAPVVLAAYKAPPSWPLRPALTARIRMGKVPPMKKGASATTANRMAQASSGCCGCQRANRPAPCASRKVTASAARPIASSTAAYRRQGLACRSASLPSHQLPAASPRKKALTAVAMAWTSTPTIRESCLIHRIWNINEAAPDSPSSAQAGARLAPAPVKVPASFGDALATPACAIRDAPWIEGLPSRAGGARRGGRRLARYEPDLPCFLACSSKCFSMALSTASCTWSTLKLAGRWLGGYSTKVCRNSDALAEPMNAR